MTNNHEHHSHEDHKHKDKHGEQEDHDHHDHHAHMIEDFKKRFWISLIITLPIMVMAPMIQHLLGYEWRFTGDRYIQFALSSVVFFYGGWPFLKGLVDEVKDRSPGMMTLISLAIAVAYIYSSAVVFGLEGQIFFWELAGLVVIMLLGHWIEMKSIMSASGALDELAKLMPSEATLVNENGENKTVNVTDLKKGDVVLVKPGEKIPVDGKVVEGKSNVNESMITGESKPVSKSKNDGVVGGSINDNGTLKVKIVADDQENYLSKVISMVEKAQKTKSKTQNLADKAAAWLFYVALGAGLITLFSWLFVGKEFEYALERMVTVMIISCPHALGLAIPLVVSISTAVSAQNGLLIRNRTAFENARKISVIIFDKTGTLTEGSFGVTRFQSVNDKYSDDDILKLSASIEQNSEHPIAGGIVKEAKEKELNLLSSENFSNITGKGVEAEIEGESYAIVSPGMLKDKGIELPKKSFTDETETVVFLLKNDTLLGFVALADKIRDSSKEAIEILKNKGIKVIMATGDNKNVAKSVSEQLDLDEFHAEVLPEDKQDIIKKLQDQGEFVAMTGDGVNDAPALAQADVGVAVGSGTDVAAETADIILVNSDPKDIVRLIMFGTSTYKKMIQNLFWAAGYNIIAIPLAAGALFWAGILLSPAVGAVLMSLSTIVVAVNAQLLRRKMG